MVWGPFKRQLCIGCVGRENLLCDAELSCVIAVLAGACSMKPSEMYYYISAFNWSSCMLYSGFLSLSKPLCWTRSSCASSGFQRIPDFCELHVWVGWTTLQICNFPQQLSCTCRFLLGEVKRGWHLFQKYGMSTRRFLAPAIVWCAKQNKTFSYIKIWHSKCHLLRQVISFVLHVMYHPPTKQPSW